MVDAAAEKPAALVERKVDPHKEQHFQEAGWKRTSFDAIVAPGVRPEDVLKPGYWAHIAARLGRMSLINVWDEHYTWTGILNVWNKGHEGAFVEFISGPHFVSKVASVRQELEFEVFDDGALKAWSVKRIKDGKIFISGQKSKAEAELALSDWLKSQSGRRAA